MKSRRVVRVGGPAYAPRRDRTPKPYRPVMTFSRIKQLVKIVVVTAVAWYLYGVFSVDHISARGNRTIPESEVVRMTRQALSEVWLANNLISLRGREVSRKLIEQNPNIRSVKFIRQWPNQLVAEVEERRPTINWQTGGQIYVLDYDGTVIGPADGASRPLVTDAANLPVEKGKQVAPSRFVAFCAQITSGLAQKTGIRVNELIVPDTTSEVHAKTDRGYIIKLDTTRGAEEQLTDLEAVLATLVRDKKTPTEYIDLRILGKAYWR